jgi:diguanylate cyclase (GGDEF)-like protein
VTLLVFDIDDFKLYNDKYGHGTGDDVLRETARLMLSVVREHDVVARIGGDEFAVIFWDNEKPRKPHSEHPHDVVAAARRFQDAICSHRFPKLLDKAVGRLTVSGGLASFPWDGRTPDELLDRADAMALQSKRQGKNAITFGTGAKRS